MKFGIIDNSIFFIYLIMTLVIGWYFKNRSKTADEYIVADRSLALSVFIATMVATSVGGGTLMGYVGKVYSGGLILIPTLVVFYSIQLIIALVLAEKLRDFAGYTAPDVLGKTFGRSSQLLGGIFSMIYMLGTGPALQTIALGKVLNVVLGIPFTYGAIAAMVIIIFYTYFSGMWGVAMTDYAQFIITAIGVGLAGIFALNKVGGWENVVASLPESYFNFDTDIKGMVELAVVVALPTLIDGNRYQRFYSAKDTKTAKKGYLMAILPWHLIFMMIILLGYTSRVLIPGVAADKVFSVMLLQTLPIGIKGLVFAALVAAIMSTADSYTLVGATNFAQDIYKPFINPKATDAELVKVTKRAVIGLGVLGLIIALAIPSVMGVWTLASTAYVGGCFVPMVAALFFKGKKSSKASLSAIVIGGGIGIFSKIADISILNQPPIVIGVICSFIVFVLVNTLDKQDYSAKLKAQ